MKLEDLANIKLEDPKGHPWFATDGFTMFLTRRYSNRVVVTLMLANHSVEALTKAIREG